jgi:cullin 1
MSSTNDKRLNHPSLSSGRQLTWMWQYSKNEIQLSYLKPKITLMCSTYQLAVLMLFNEEESLHFGDIEARTKMAPDVLKSVMNILVKSKILLADGDTYDINYNFKSKKVGVNIRGDVSNRCSFCRVSSRSG